MKILIYLFDGVTALDAVGPYESLQRLPECEIRLAGALNRFGSEYVALFISMVSTSLLPACRRELIKVLRCVA
jgi:hypothetical protein